MAELPLPLIQLTGTPAEIGGRLGERTSGAVAESIAWYRRQFQDAGGLSSADLARLGGGFREQTAAWHPRIAAALDALADGAGVDVADVYAINARTELMSASPLPPVDGCTAAAVTEGAGAKRHLLLGQNWDWGVDVPDTTVLLATRDERGHGVVTLAEPGMLAKTGLNDAGVGLTVNILRTGADAPAAGVPYHVRLRAVLEQRDFDGARRAAEAGPCAASINMMVAHGGRAVDLEVTPDGVHAIDPDGGLLVHTNHCVIESAADDVGPLTMPSTTARQSRAQHILDGKRGAITAGDLRAVFTDHDGGIDRICRHAGADPRVAPGDKTVYSVVMDLDDRTFAVARGPVCENPHVERTLTELLP
ncbi:C45 family autoproteolytic acyltransferase/hydolase [Spelaeicoccus albus]|uniref:Isopenicillin-N N-acyltransferase-like protein n=1 Tax=Spelaeicoccus albus TaxID=1280376 RepID=A0A7Z0A9H4_9MICO|nr:C45 family peptidase [Spelaeicoccus albus]NYI66859.1 isopenicillin-N N-acyltransferase-like protein [Spelaeicoccus albus]